MKAKRTRWLVGLAVGLLLPAVASADPPAGCPGCSYPPAGYRFPILWNLHERLVYGRAVETYGSACEAQVPPSYYVYRPHCPSVSPATLYDYPSLAVSPQSTWHGEKGK